MRRIILLTFLFSVCSHGKSCFTLNKKKYEVEKLKNNAVGVTALDNKVLTRWFYCQKSKKVMTCSGEDDAGDFKMTAKEFNIVSSISLGTPDGPNRTLKSKKALKLLKCP